MLRIAFPAALGAAFLLAAPASSAVAIPGLFNTGVTSSSTVTTGIVLDPHWIRASGQAWNSGINGNFPIGPWIADSATSRWVTPTSDAAQSFDPTADGLYTYSLSFSLAGFLPATASFTGRFAADNMVDSILLNGVPIFQAGPGGFTFWTAFSSLGGTFLPGTNTLSFTVRNFAQSGGNPTGLRVEFLGSSVMAVPEAGTWAMLIAGFGLVGASIRRRRGRMVVETA